MLLVSMRVCALALIVMVCAPGHGAPGAPPPGSGSLLLVVWPTTNAAQRRDSAAAVTALEAHLAAAGLRADRVPLADLAGRAGDGAVALVPWSDSLEETEPLRAFLGGGGRAVLFAPGTASVLAAAGARSGVQREGPSRAAPLRVLPAGARRLAGAPGTVTTLIPAGLPLAASDEAVLAQWVEPLTAPAVVRTPAALIAGFRLPEAPSHETTRLLIALVAHFRSATWRDAYAAVLQRASTRADQVRARVAVLTRRVSPPSTLSDLQRRARAMEARMGNLRAPREPAQCAAGFPALQRAEDDARVLAAAAVPAQPGEVRGVWIHTYAPTDWEQVMRRLREAGCNSVFVRVGRGGNVIYPSALLPRDPWAEQAGGDELQRAIEAARRNGIDFHAWRVCYHMRSAPRAYYDRMAAEDRLVRDAEGKQSFWANPADPRNAELEFQAMLELATRYDLQGLHFDYIRYPDEPHYDFDYGPVSRAEFEKALGRPVGQWPQDVIYGPLKRAYEDWERENINRLVERVYREVKAQKPALRISAAVWRNHRRYRAVIKQDWLLWVERGWLDFVVPMDYTADAEEFRQTVEGQVAAVDGRVPVVAGIGTWLQPSPDQVVDQVEIARRAGASGYVLFAYNDARIQSILGGLALGANREPTLPAYAAPLIELKAPGSLRGKDVPRAVVAGGPLQLEAAYREAPGAPTRAPAQVFLEDPDGRRLVTVGRLAPGGAALSVVVKAPRGRFQLVARGQLGGQEFVVRGPLLDGLSSRSLAELRAQDAPPRVTGDGVRTAVYMGGLGAEGILAALRQLRGVVAYPVHRLRPDHFGSAQILILPQLRDVADLTVEAENALRQWVADGGTLLLTHDAVGFRWHPVLFPEIGRGAGLGPKQTLRATLPGQAEWTIEHSYRDQVRIEAASGAVTLACEAAEGGAPVVVSGAHGKGRVVLLGILPGVLGDEKLTPSEARLLASLVAR